MPHRGVYVCTHIAQRTAAHTAHPTSDICANISLLNVRLPVTSQRQRPRPIPSPPLSSSCSIAQERSRNTLRRRTIASLCTPAHSAHGVTHPLSAWEGARGPDTQTRWWHSGAYCAVLCCIMVYVRSCRDGGVGGKCNDNFKGMRVRV